jgi:polar amino acid transport system substrate-binding protein
MRRRTNLGTSPATRPGLAAFLARALTLGALSLGALALGGPGLGGLAAPAPAQARELLLTTENYPPFNMQEEGSQQIIGISTDIVRRLMVRAGINYSIKFLPWQRAYAMALDETDTCVFSTTLTEERRPLFKWVGPLVSNDWVFFGRPDSELAIDSIEDVRPYVIGGYKGDAVAVFLEQQGMELDLASHDHVNPAKLAAGRFDIWATGNHLGPYLARQAGVEIKPLFTFKETVMGLACNQSVDDGLIAQLNALLEELREDGSVAEVMAKYQG